MPGVFTEMELIFFPSLSLSLFNRISEVDSHECQPRTSSKTSVGQGPEAFWLERRGWETYGNFVLQVYETSY